MAGVGVRVALAVAVVLVAACGRTSFRTPSAASGEVVRGPFGEFFWAAEAGPDVPLEVAPDPDAVRRQVARSMAAVRADLDDVFSLAIVATFPTTTDAATAASTLREVLVAADAWFADPANAIARRQLLDPERDAPMSPPEAAALSAANLAPGTRGIGWAGRNAGSGDPADSVWTIGPTVIVTGLKAETATSPDAPPIHPIAHLWAAAGATVLLEGDRAGEGAIVTDLSCRPADTTQGETLRDAIGDQLDVSAWSGTPPWVAEPTPDQARARRDVSRYQAIAAGALDDPEIFALYQRLAAASAWERQPILDELARKVPVAIRAAAEGRVDPAVLDVIARHPVGDDQAAREAWNREIGALIGQVEMRPGGSYPTADALGPIPYGGSVRVADGRLEIAWLTFARTSTGLPLLLAWLTERGCTDVRLRLTDYDAVRP